MDTILEEVFSAQTLLLASLSYALGAVPFGLILTRWRTGKNLREVGSRNIGATNATRAAGPIVGALTLLLDVGKAYLPGSIAFSLGASVDVAAFCGFCAFLGHCFPAWLRFSGGKGVAPALGVLISLSMTLALFAIVGFVAGYALFKQVGAGSLAASAVGALASFFILETSMAKVIVLLMAIIIFVRHEENIRRMFSREEI